MDIQQIHIKVEGKFLSSYKVTDHPGKFVLTFDGEMGCFDNDDYIVKVIENKYKDLEIFPAGYRSVKQVKEIVPTQKEFDWI